MGVVHEQARSALSKSRLPGLDYALNPYRGCAHACIYCYAPDVLYDTTTWGESVEVKCRIENRLAAELRRLEPGVVGVGTVTDAYQPIERKLEVTRHCLELLARRPFPVSVLTKSGLVARDKDLLANCNDAEVGFSVTTLDKELARLLEPRAPSPVLRLNAAKELAGAGVRTYIMLGPIIPWISDTDEALAKVVRAAADCGAAYIMVDRLNPHRTVWPRIENGLRGHPETLGRVRAGMGRSDYFEHAVRRLEVACRGTRIGIKRAFSSGTSYPRPT